ncbi:MAG: hypothetical protein RL748_2174, partial [Pseudomonadota bacterium]
MPASTKTAPGQAIHPALLQTASARKEAAHSAAFDLARRKAAQTILHPDEISGDYDAGRLLMTTRGGEIRPLTIEDLRAFQSHIRQLKKRYQGGIQAQSVIDLALEADRRRANQEIRFAVPHSVQGGKVHFITNAGPKSTVTRHHVMVVFLDFDATVAASPNEPKRLANMVTKGRLLFDCDCERHTFWFRYIATIGKYNTGRNETGYPKIRNPGLVGVACKHVLRTMNTILRDAAFQQRIAQSVLAARGVLDQRAIKIQRTRAEQLRQEAQAQSQKRAAQRELRTSDDKKQAAAMRKAQRELQQSAGQLY